MVPVEIDLRARRVDEVRTEHGVTLGLSGGAVIRIECPFRIVEPAASMIIDPDNLSADLRLGANLRGRLVEVTTADEDTGVLAIRFLGGLALTISLGIWGARQ